MYHTCSMFDYVNLQTPMAILLQLLSLFVANLRTFCKDIIPLKSACMTHKLKFYKGDVKNSKSKKNEGMRFTYLKCRGQNFKPCINADLKASEVAHHLRQIWQLLSDYLTTKSICLLTGEPCHHSTLL